MANETTIDGPGFVLWANYMSHREHNPYHCKVEIFGFNIKWPRIVTLESEFDCSDYINTNLVKASDNYSTMKLTLDEKGRILEITHLGEFQSQNRKTSLVISEPDSESIKK